MGSRSDAGIPPLIVTLRLDAAAQGYFDALRQEHFPPQRNFLAAHLTLFHHLPGACLDRVVETLKARAAALARLALQVVGLRLLGRGVAFRLECQELRALHRRLLLDFDGMLTPQDRQALSPHVTIQNKVDRQVATQLHERLQALFRPFDAQGLGLELWHYLDGPWRHIAHFPFGAGAGAGAGADAAGLDERQNSAPPECRAGEVRPRD